MLFLYLESSLSVAEGYIICLLHGYPTSFSLANLPDGKYHAAACASRCYGPTGSCSKTAQVPLTRTLSIGLDAFVCYTFSCCFNFNVNSTLGHLSSFDFTWLPYQPYTLPFCFCIIFGYSCICSSRLGAHINLTNTTPTTSNLAVNVVSLSWVFSVGSWRHGYRMVTPD